jgi:large subunit ribosomal protein L9
MEIILLEKVGKLGTLGDVVKVKNGYARNFLIPQGKARRATADSKAAFEARRQELEKAAIDKLQAAQTLANKLSATVVRISQKAGVDGRLFGSVTALDIAQALTQQGYAIQKAQIRLPQGPIKLVGDSTVQVALHTDVQLELTVSIYGETV